MAEVGARFALDGMPGKQLAIDSDMSAGAIDHQQAKERREREQQETTFFGSLDGASKFVKGDAIAGLLITLAQPCDGADHGRDRTRHAGCVRFRDLCDSDRWRRVGVANPGRDHLNRFGVVAGTRGHPRGHRHRHLFAIGSPSCGSVHRGGPDGPVCVGARTAISALHSWGGRCWDMRLIPFTASGKRKKPRAQLPSTATETPVSQAIGDILDLDDVHLEFAPDLVSMVLNPGTGLDARIANMRTYVASTFGLILPEIRLTDRADLPTGAYVIKVQGVEQARGVLNPDLVLALVQDEFDLLPEGNDVTEPVYGAPARWILPKHQEDAALSGATIVSPPEILATHLLEIIKQNFSRLLDAEIAAAPALRNDPAERSGSGRGQ